MKRLLLLSVVVLMISASAYAASGNWISNGDFESGMAGWTIGSFGTTSLSTQLFTAASPAKIGEHNGNTGIADATAMPAYSGTSVGWARSGVGASAAPIWTYVSQTVNVAAGTYTVSDASWKVIAGNTERDFASAGMFLMRVDGQIGTAYDGSAGTYVFRSTKWDYQDPRAAWYTKSVAAGSTFTTTTGNVQFILAFQDNDAVATYTGARYSYAAFDNVVFTTNESPVVPEPSGLLALFSGAAGLAGFVIRRKK